MVVSNDLHLKIKLIFFQLAFYYQKHGTLHVCRLAQKEVKWGGGGSWAKMNSWQYHYIIGVHLTTECGM